MNKNIITFLLTLFVLSFNSCFAKDFSKDVTNVINNSNIKKGCISVSIKLLENKKTVYELP